MDKHPVISRVKSVSNTLDKAIGLVCAVFFGTMTIAVLLGVFFRYVLNNPLSWPEELSRYLMIWGASVAISLGIKSDEHVGLTVLYDLLKSRSVKTVLRAITYLLVLVFLVSLFLYSIRMVQDAQYMQTMDLRITMVVPYMAIPVSMLLSIVQLVLVFVIRTAEADEPHADIRIIDI